MELGFFIVTHFLSISVVCWGTRSHEYVGLEQNIWWPKSDLILRPLDHTKDQDQVSDLDLLDQDHWCFNSSERQTKRGRRGRRQGLLSSTHTGGPFRKDIVRRRTKSLRNGPLVLQTPFKVVICISHRSRTLQLTRTSDQVFARLLYIRSFYVHI